MACSRPRAFAPASITRSRRRAFGSCRTMKSPSSRLCRAAEVVRLESAELRPAEELERFIAGLAGDGAVVSFVGLARPAGADGEALTGLFLDAYPGMTEKSLDAIAADALAKFAISAVHIVHGYGEIAAGAAIVFAAAAAPHRRAAFDACDYLMDR